MKTCNQCKGSGLIKDKIMDGISGGYPMFETCEICKGRGMVK